MPSFLLPSFLPGLSLSKSFSLSLSLLSLSLSFSLSLSLLLSLSFLDSFLNGSSSTDSLLEKSLLPCEGLLFSPSKSCLSREGLVVLPSLLSLSGLPSLTGLPSLSGLPSLTGLPSLSGLPSLAGLPSLSGLLSLTGLTSSFFTSSLFTVVFFTASVFSTSVLTVSAFTASFFKLSLLTGSFLKGFFTSSSPEDVLTAESSLTVVVFLTILLSTVFLSSECFTVVSLSADLSAAGLGRARPRRLYGFGRHREPLVCAHDLASVRDRQGLRQHPLHHL